jgi:hypothetical protein
MPREGAEENGVVEANAAHAAVAAKQLCGPLLHACACAGGGGGSAPQVMALVSAFGVGVSVAYIDASGSSVLSVHTFPDGCPPGDVLLTLLYRPGHYDVLYAAAAT